MPTTKSESASRRERLDDIHISRSWGDDRFALDGACPCEPLVCGMVSALDASAKNCPEHGSDALGGKTIRGMHPALACPTREGTND